MFSMNRATAMISGTMRSRRMEWRPGGGGVELKGAYQPQSGGARKAVVRDHIHNSHPRLS
jgi:hypothetical protein